MGCKVVYVPTVTVQCDKDLQQSAQMHLPSGMGIAYI
jgi:hypothetical protein